MIGNNIIANNRDESRIEYLIRVLSHSPRTAAKDPGPNSGDRLVVGSSRSTPEAAYIFERNEGGAGG